jgi:hypothetical protein
MLRTAILLAIAILVALAARDALTGNGIFAIYSGLMSLALLAVLLGTIFKTRAGINAAAVNCPNCNTSQPVMRKPTSFRQAMWGGYTCSQCATEMDKWGRRIDA